MACAEFHDGRDLLGGSRQDDDARQMLFQRVGVALVNEQFVFARDDTISADDSAKLRQELPRSHISVGVADITDEVTPADCPLTIGN